MKKIHIYQGVECVLVSKISVPDAFAGFGEVIFINEFAKEIKG